jgi:dTDP-4-amino-4,6-dideoxygalactose transaminase
MPKIPVFELKRQFQQIKGEIHKGVNRVLSSGFYALGREVSAFEKEFAKYNRVKYALGLASGTDALKLALQALNIGKDDEVITTPLTFFSTSEAIYNVGAKIVFADIDLGSYNICPLQIEKKITKKTKAILCVHLYGQPCQLQPILRICRKYKLRLIEDCAQATGAEYRGRKVGSFGDAGCFSFYPTKNLGAYGEGGMITTNNRNLARLVAMLRVHGARNKYQHILHGHNSRLDELQAAILRTKLLYLDKWNRARREKGAYYNERLSLLEERGYIRRPLETKDAKHVFHLYVLRTGKRNRLMNFLKSRGIGTSCHYPIALHQQEVYKDLGFSHLNFPKSESAARELISLPLYPELTKKEIDYIIKSIFQFFEGKKGRAG